MEIYAQSYQQVMDDLATTLEGLTHEQAVQRMHEHGANTLPLPPKPNIIVRFVRQLNHVLIILLLMSALISVMLQFWMDAAVIAGVVLINALIGLIQEGKAEQALAMIRTLLPLTCLVRRDGVRQQVDADLLTLGDIVIVRTGDKVPADLRIISSQTCEILESALTGESLSVEKSSDAVTESTPLAERSSMAYSGTYVTQGSLEGVVVAVGPDTEMGKISSMLGSVEEVSTPLLKKMVKFARLLTLFIVVIALLTIVFGIWVRGYAFDHMFMAAVSLAVAAIPEGLPAIITIALSVGVVRMAQRRAIIRHLPAIETMGAVTTICTDKTGTLTRNELTVQQVVAAKGTYQVTGSGYNDQGQIQRDDQTVELAKDSDLERLVHAGVYCNDAELHCLSDQWIMTGAPIEGALLSLALKAGVDVDALRSQSTRLGLLPFESETKYMAVLQAIQDHTQLFVKGAPEQLLHHCTWQWQDQQRVAIDKSYWHEQCRALALSGQRLIGLAQKLDVSHQQLSVSDMEDLTFLGMVAMIDPPRTEVAQAVRDCENAGIRVKMITGDHELTARAIAQQIGMNTEYPVVSGAELDQIDDAQLAERIDQMTIFSRTTPQHKLRLVQVLQAQHQVVAMTGDGVNDAPALKGADIGIAMGVKGTEVSREASDMVLADDCFESIRDAVREGRVVYQNIKKAILYILPNSFGEAFAIILAIFLGTTLPITPLQVLWVNMVTTVTLDLSLAFEPAEMDVMRQPPHPANDPLLSQYTMWRVIFISLMIVSGAFGLFYYELSLGASVATARSVVVNAFVASEIVYLFNCRKIIASSINKAGFTGNKVALLCVAIVVCLQLGFTYLPIMQHFFKVAPLHLSQWSRIVLFAGGLFFAIELEKWIRRRRIAVI